MSSHPLRVLFVNGTSERGGADTDLLTLCQGLVRAGVECHVVLPAEGPLSRAFRDAGCTLSYLDPAPIKRLGPQPRTGASASAGGLGRLLASVARLRAVAFDAALLALRFVGALVGLATLIRQRRPTVVHINSVAVPAAALAAWLMRTPVVWHVREIELITRSRLFAILLFASMRTCATRIVAISGAVRDVLPPDLQARTLVIHHGIDTETYTPAAGDRPVRVPGVALDQPVVGFVGRLSPIKGLATLIEATRILRAGSNPGLRLRLIGPELGYGEHVAALRAQVERSGMTESVTFDGEVSGGPDLADVYRAIDVLVLPTLIPEGLGLVLLEALACGTPVIATNHGGPVEILRDCPAARLVPPGDAVALAEAIADLLPRTEALAPIARAYALERFSLNRPVASLLALYCATTPGD